MSGMGSTGFSSFQFVDKGLNVILATRVGHDGEVMLAIPCQEESRKQH